MDEKRSLKPVRTRPALSIIADFSSSSSSASSSPAVAYHGQKPSSGGGGDFSSLKKGAMQRDAARRLAQVVETHTGISGDEELLLYGEEDDRGLELGPPPPLLPGLGLGIGHHASGNGVGDHDRHRHNSHRRRDPSPNFVEHAPSVSSASSGRSATTPRLNTEAPLSEMPEQTPVLATENKRLPDLGHLYPKDPGNEHEEYAGYDELDILHDENLTLLEKLEEAERKCQEAEARARFLEKQVESLGEGASLESSSLRRKREELRQREEALKAARQRRVGKEEIAKLRSEINSLREAAAETAHKLQQTESEAESLRAMTQRMILSHEEMEEVVLKRCWLARYWGLAVNYGICADIAGSKYEFWSAFAPLPFEVVISAGQKAREDFLIKGEKNSNGLSKHRRDPSDHIGEGNIETLLSVEMGLKEMASLKIEDAIVLSMVQQRRPNYNAFGDPKFFDSFELSQEESKDVRFKEAWLIYFWKRAMDHQIEGDIAEERLDLWTSRLLQPPTLQDAVDVERGLIELRKLGIQEQLWEACRRELPMLIEEDAEKYAMDLDNSP